MTGRGSDGRTRTAVVGLGWVACNRHLPVLAASREFSVVGVIDSRPGRAGVVAARFGLARHTEASQLRDVPWLDEVDAIVVATNPHQHHRLVQEALQAGKHVLTEKPFAMSPAEGEDMILSAKHLGRTLAVVHNFQFARSMLRLERDIAHGHIGEIRTLWGFQFGNPSRRLPQWYDELPLGLFYDESPHLLYLLRRLGGGGLELVSADVGPVPVGVSTPSTVSARFRATRAGREVPVVLSMFFEAPVSEWYLMVLGERGLGVVDIFRDIYVRLPNDGTHSAATVIRTSAAGTWQHWAQYLSSGALHVAGRLRYGNDVVYRRFAEAIRTGAPPEGVSASDGLDVLRLQHAILDASRQNRR